LFDKEETMKFISLLLLFFKLNCNSEINPSLKFFLEPQESIGINLEESDGSTDLFEGTTTDTYTITLKSKPFRNYGIRINFDQSQLIINENQSSPVILVFNSENWNIPQTVSVRAVFDGRTEGNMQSIITHSQNYSPTSIYNLGSIRANISDNFGSRLTTSFQSGTVTLAAINTIIPLTTAVNSSKAYVYCNFQISNSASSRAATCQINSSGTQVEIIAGVIGSNTVVNWYVAEFSQGADVQRSVVNFSSSDSTILITLSKNIDLSRTFVIIYSRTTDGSLNQDEQRYFTARLTSQSTLNITRQDTGVAVDVEWQVIQLDGARVQSGQTIIPNGSSSVQATIGLVSLTDSFIIMNNNGSANINGRETDLYVQASYTDSRTVNFRRTGNQDSVTVSWYSIEMIDGTTVQSGSVSVAGTSANAQASLNSVETGKTMIAMTYRVETGNSPEATQDSGTFSSIFLNSTTIQFNRAVPENNICEITWFAVTYQ
jgi:large repetitive protein